ncbi:MAG: cytochrome c3 family protein [Acidobacteria bacterium]|nr:cytochrome c3 family protein [Acidobacteriota bacterium]
MVRVLSSVVVVMLIAAGGLLLMKPSGASNVTQPIAFNHKKHMDNGLECNACHETVQHSAIAGRPKLETCLLCHETALTQSAEEEKVRQYAQRHEEIPWQRLFRLPAHVYFSHQTHVVAGKLECQVCHGDIAQTTKPPTRAVVNLTMDDCIACHTTRRASTDCNACHK